MVMAMPPELFSVTFQLRKKSPVFPGLLEQVSILQQNNFHLVFSTNGRWLHIDCYEKSQQHPALSVRKMLASIPVNAEKMKLSALNFAASHYSKMSFSISDIAPEFTIVVHKPSRAIDLKHVVDNCKLLGIPIAD